MPLFVTKAVNPSRPRKLFALSYGDIHSDLHDNTATTPDEMILLAQERAGHGSDDGASGPHSQGAIRQTQTPP